MRRSLALVPVLVVLSIAVPPAPATAALEVTPLVGYGSGGFEFSTGVVCVQSPCPSYAESESSLQLGAALGVDLRDRLQLELLVSRQPGQLAFRDSSAGPRNGLPEADLDLTHLHAGLLRSWSLSSVEPFAVLGAGLTRIEGDRIGGMNVVDEDRVSASLGGGVKVPLRERLALRVEGRGFWIDAPRSLGGETVQVEASTGISFRW